MADGQTEWLQELLTDGVVLLEVHNHDARGHKGMPAVIGTIANSKDVRRRLRGGLVQ